MLKSLWLRLTLSGPSFSDEETLARYYRIEGLHAELALHLAREGGAPVGHERTLYAAHSYFIA